MIYVGVVGPGSGADLTPDLERAGEEVGRLLAVAGATIVCGGMGGVMDAAARGAAGAGGRSVGVLPGAQRTGASEYLTIALATGLGQARNAVLVNASDVLIAIGEGAGTLSEIALAMRAGKPVVGLHTWALPAARTPIERATDAVDAVSIALELAADDGSD